MRIGVPGGRAQEDLAWSRDLRKIEVHRMPLLPGRMSIQCSALPVVEAGALRNQV